MDIDFIFRRSFGEGGIQIGAARLILTLSPRQIRGSNNVNNIRPSRAHSLMTAVLAGIVLFAASPAVATPDHETGSQAALPKPGTGNFVQRFIRELRGNGLEVSVGYPRLYTQADCPDSYEAFHNCFGNNPASPYVMPIVQSWQEEYVDPATENGFGRTRPGYSATYRLDPREAIILFGRMPPPARYLGLQTWAFSTGWLSNDSPWYQDACNNYASFAKEMTQYFFATVPPISGIDPADTAAYCAADPGSQSRALIFASIGNNINNVAMEQQSGLPWNQIRYFVITPDQLTDEAVRAALTSLGVDEGEIFTEEIPDTFQDVDHEPPYPYGQNPVVGPLGLGEDAVDFTTAVRYALPEDEQAGKVWLKSLPLTVLRVRRPFWGPDPETWGDRIADARPTVNELHDPELMSNLGSLILAVIGRAESRGWTLEEQAPMIDILNRLGQFGPACREIGMNCLGDGQDASYYFAQPRKLDTGKIYAAVGTLAKETGNATYVGLSVNDASLLKGALNIDDTKLKGSANSYYSEVLYPDILEQFFVHFFTRDCAAIADLTDGACTTITPDLIPLEGDDSAPGDADLHGRFSMAVRSYVVPDFERGPDPTKQLPPNILTFSRE